jgi:hypothetical protein
MSVFNLAQKRSFPPLCIVSVFILKRPRFYGSFTYSGFDKSLKSIFLAVDESGFTKEYEVARREAKRYHWEQWRALKIFLEQFDKKDTTMVAIMREHFIEIMARHDLTREADGYDKIRGKISQTLGNAVQDKLEKLQNPRSSCSNTRSMVHSLIKCVIHFRA